MEFNDQQIPAFRRGYRLQWEQTQNCHVILYPEGMAKLNESATAILHRVDGVRSVATLIAELDTQFPDAGGVGGDVREFFVKAWQQKWIIFREPS